MIGDAFPKLSLRELERRPGLLHGVVSIDDDHSEWVRISKADLLRVLRAEGAIGVDLIVLDDGTLGFLGARYEDER